MHRLKKQWVTYSIGISPKLIGEGVTIVHARCITARRGRFVIVIIIGSPDTGSEVHRSGLLQGANLVGHATPRKTHENRVVNGNVPPYGKEQNLIINN